MSKRLRTRENSSSGWFFDGGLGGGLNHFKLTTYNKSDVSYENFSSFVASAQVGGYHYFNEWVYAIAIALILILI